MASNYIKRTTAFIVVVGFFASTLQVVVTNSLTFADPLPAHWLDTSADPSLQSGETINNATYTDVNKKPHEECVQKTYVTRPARTGQSQQTTNRCWYKTSMGMVSGNYVVGDGQSIAGQITGRTSGYNLYPTPNENVVLDRYYNGANGSYRFRYNPSLIATTRSNGSLAYAITYESSFTIGFENSSSLSGYDITYSDDGKYAMFSRNTTLARVNLHTKQILTYSAPSGWYSGNPMDTTASISDDGTYAVVTAGRTSNVRWMRVFDLNDCQDGEYSYIRPGSTNSKCTHQNFKSFIESNIPSFSYFTAGEFVDDETIDFYHRVGSSTYTYTKYTMSIGGSGGSKYFALGDSLSSGEGAFSYVYPTAETSPKNQCHTSNKSYPYLINDQLSLSGFASFACSGATIPNIVGANGVKTDFASDPYSDNQWYHEDYETTHYWSPGFDNQLKKVKKEKPNIVTISIGINDIGFEKKLASCLKWTDTCFESYEDRKELANEMKSIFNKSVNTYKRLKSATAPGAKIYVAGYPQVVNPSSLASCANNVRLDADERQFITDATEYLNSVVEAAADKAGIHYLDIEDALNGYRHCEGGTGSVAVNGLTKGDDFNLGPATLWQEVFGKETYHPNKLGHQLLRNAVITETNSFTQPMPAPDSTITAPAVTDTIPLLINAPKNNRTIQNTVYAHGMVNNIVVKTSNLVAAIKGHEFATRSGSAFTAELHSTPVSLGTFTSNDNGDINISAAIPNTVEPGFHTLHAYGKDVDGNDIDIYKNIYVAEAEDDWDGDEILNDEDECVMIEPSGIDEDEDGIDDACDPIIGELIDLDEEEELAFVSNSNKYTVNARATRTDYRPEEYLIS